MPLQLFGLHCPSCGNKISESDHRCPSCGIDLDAPLSPTEATLLARQSLEKAKQIYASGRRLDSALEECDLAITLAPDSAEAHNFRGIILDSQGETRQAAAAYRAALELDPHYQDARDNLADAEKELETVEPGYAERAKRAAHYVKSASRFCPRCNREIHESFWLCPACGYELQKPAEQSEQDLASENTSLDVLAGRTLERAEAAYEAGNLQEALAECERVIGSAFSSAEAYNFRGVVLDELGQLDEAILSYQEALRLEPDHPEARENLAGALADLKEEARDYYEQADAIYSEGGDLDLALEECQRALAGDPDLAGAHYLLGLILEEKDMPVEAERSFQTALRLDPTLEEASPAPTRAEPGLTSPQPVASTTIQPENDRWPVIVISLLVTLVLLGLLGIMFLVSRGLI